MSESRGMTPTEEMAEVLAAEKMNAKGSPKRLYKQQSDEHKSELLQMDIANKREVLKAGVKREKVDFSNLQMVQDRTFAYMEACEKAGVFPSIMGLATHGFGISRQALNQYLLRNNNATTDFINLVKDCFADILSNAGLYGNAHPIMAIFQLKNQHGFSDKLEIAPATPERMDRDYDPEDIRRRYLSSCVDADTDE